MIIKRSIAGISALLIAASMPCFTAFAADTEDGVQGDGYSQAAMNAVVYTDDNVQAIGCRYFDDMPNVPYVLYL